MKQPFEARLSGAGYSLENLRNDLCVAAASQALFKPDDNCSSFTPWVRDIVAPEHEKGEQWLAMIQGRDGKLYQVKFTITDKTVAIVGDPTEVVQQVDYSPAVQAGDGEQPRKDDGKFHGAAGRQQRGG